MVATPPLLGDVQMVESQYGAAYDDIAARGLERIGIALAHGNFHEANVALMATCGELGQWRVENNTAAMLAEIQAQNERRMASLEREIEKRLGHIASRAARMRDR